MSKQKHTPGPWAWDGSTKAWTYAKDANKTGWTLDVFDLAETGDPSTDYETAKANARRIVACVNACEGISTHDIEALGLQLSGTPDLRQQRDELLAALIRLRDCPDVQMEGTEPETDAARLQANAAVAKCKGA